ncbi:MAG: replication factor C large subunit [Candidatus Thorarchaeota archaeon]
MTNVDQPWTERFRPTCRSDLVGNEEVIDRLYEWVRGWDPKTTRNRGAILVGRPGIGKTSAVVALSRDLNLELVEYNASDSRNKAVVETQVWRSATQETLDGRGRIVLLEEIDGISGSSDRGGISAIEDLIDHAVHPIVMTANDIEDKRFDAIQKKCMILQFQPVSEDKIVEALSVVLRESGARCEKEVLRAIAERAGGDLRAAILDLEVACRSDHGQTWQPPDRDHLRGVSSSIRRLFMAASIDGARRAVAETDVDHETLVLWLEENISKYLLTEQELESGFDALSLSDYVLGRIMRRQDWKMLGYVYDFISVGVGRSRTETPYREVENVEPQWPLLIWRGGKALEKTQLLVEMISRAASISHARARTEILWVIKEIVRRNPRQGQLMQNWIGVKP